MERLSTCYNSPYALILRGGSVPGQRPRTKMAFLTEAVAKDNKIVAYKARIWLGDRYSKRTVELSAIDIVFTWQQEPHPGQIANAKKRIRLPF